MTTLRTYLKLQAMMFTLGIVGPIFLVLYFVIQPDPTVRWMYFAGLIVTAADIVIALLLTESATRDR